MIRFFADYAAASAMPLRRCYYYYVFRFFSFAFRCRADVLMPRAAMPPPLRNMLMRHYAMFTLMRERHNGASDVCHGASMRYAAARGAYVGDYATMRCSPLSA